jgi:hypothetical protein
MNTLVTGAAATMFAALHTAFVWVAGMGQVVMTVTLSNACPVGEGDGETQGHF